MEEYECELCGEATDFMTDPAGEFWDKVNDKRVVAHAQCGLDAALDLA
jgi:hypothetical protein